MRNVKRHCTAHLLGGNEDAFAAMCGHDHTLCSHMDVFCVGAFVLAGSRGGRAEDLVDEQFADGIGAGSAGENDGYLVFGGVLPEGFDASGLE